MVSTLAAVANQMGMMSRRTRAWTHQKRATKVHLERGARGREMGLEGSFRACSLETGCYLRSGFGR